MYVWCTIIGLASAGLAGGVFMEDGVFMAGVNCLFFSYPLTSEEPSKSCFSGGRYPG